MIKVYTKTGEVKLLEVNKQIDLFILAAKYNRWEFI